MIAGFLPGQCWKYISYVGTDGEDYYLRVPDREPYPGYLRELEQRDVDLGEVGAVDRSLAIDTLGFFKDPSRIVLKKFELPWLKGRAAAAVYLAVGEPYEPLPDWVAKELGIDLDSSPKDQPPAADT